MSALAVQCGDAGKLRITYSTGPVDALESQLGSKQEVCVHVHQVRGVY